MKFFCIRSMVGLAMIGAALLHAGESKGKLLRRSSSAISFRDYQVLHPSFVRSSEQMIVEERVQDLSPEPSSNESDSSDEEGEGKVRSLRDPFGMPENLSVPGDPILHCKRMPRFRTVSPDIAAILVRYEANYTRKHGVNLNVPIGCNNPDVPPFAQLIFGVAAHAGVVGIFASQYAYTNFLETGKKLLLRGADLAGNVHVSYQENSVTVTCKQLLQTLREFHCKHVKNASMCAFLEGLERTVAAHKYKKTIDDMLCFCMPSTLTSLIFDYGDYESIAYND